MKLVKTNENSSRNYDRDGNVSHRSENASYGIVDDDGNVMANASVSITNESGSLSVSINDIDTVDEGEDRIRELFGIPG